MPDEPGAASRSLLNVSAQATPAEIEAAYVQRLAELRTAFLDLGGFPRDPAQRALRFDNFVVGDSNHNAFHLARQVAEGPSTLYNPLFIHGGCGLGKTHLLQAIVNQVGDRRQHLALCCSAHNFVEEMIVSMARNRLSEFRGKYRHLQYLLMDDVQMLGTKSRAQEEAYSVLNQLVASGAQVVLAGRDLPDHEVGVGLRSRMAQSVHVEIQFPELPERVEMVARKAELLGLTLSRPVVYCLARKPIADVRELEASVKRLHEHHRKGGDLDTLSQVETALYGNVGACDGRVTPIGDIQEVVSRHFNLAVRDLVSGKGTLRVKRARQIALYLARELCHASPEDFRRNFHAEPCQVTYAQKKIKNGLSDPLLAEDLRGIAQALQELGSRR
jgi:chromosomal replication initiator protein